MTAAAAAAVMMMNPAFAADAAYEADLCVIGAGASGTAAAWAAAEKGMKNGTLLWPVRIAMAGKAVTPGGAIEIGVLLGKDETMRRLKIGLEKLQ